MKTTLLFVAILFSSCSANWHLKRAIKKNPELLKPTEVVITHRDTILVKDTITIEGIDTSLVFDLDSLRAVVLNDSTTINLLRQSNGKLLLEVKRMPKIEYRELRIPYEVKVPCKCPPTITCSLTSWEKFYISAGKFFLLFMVVGIIVLMIKR